MNGPEDDEDLHVLIVAETQESLDKAEELVKDILFNPQKAMALKQDQLRKVGHCSYPGSLGPALDPFVAFF